MKVVYILYCYYRKQKKLKNLLNGLKMMLKQELTISNFI